MATAQRKIPAPEPNPETKAFWDAATQGKLLIKKCRACGEVHYYPRALCPFCGSDQTEWQAAAGTGTLYSYSVMRRAEIPYAIAYVTLDEGVSMMTNLVDCDFDTLMIGQRMKVVFSPTDGGPPVPTFTPAR
jgi:uncharacterized OB-fold protein